MCKQEIYERTITAIEADIVGLNIEYSDTHFNDHSKRYRIKQSIGYAEEIIDDLKQENSDE